MVDALLYAVAMSWVWVALAMVVVLLVACMGYVGWRDRRRARWTEDASAGRAATSDAERHEAGRHRVQGMTWDKGRSDGFP